MSIRFQADNDLKKSIIAATFRRESTIDFKSAQSANLDSVDDQAVLGIAASEGRILVSHDKRTMPKQFASFLRQGNHSPGVLLVIPQDAGLSLVVDTFGSDLGRQSAGGLGRCHHGNSVLIVTSSRRGTD